MVAQNMLAQDPYGRAHDRIENLMDRGVDVRKHTVARLNRCKDLGKVWGIYQAAKDYGWSDVASQALAKYRALGGRL